MSMVVGVIAMGEMGSGVGARLAAKGARVLTDLTGRSPASVKRAQAAGIEGVDSLDQLAECRFILSILPPANAGDLAQKLLPAIGAAARKPVYIDCNAIAPETVRAIAAPFEAAGLPFVDGGIVGGPPKGDDAGPRLYVSGARAEEALELRDYGLDMRVTTKTVGDASALKMSYAGITKGFQALGSAMILGATQGGAAEALWEEMSASQPLLLGWLSRQIPGLYSKAYRWVGEMEEIAKFLAAEEGSATMLKGAGKLYVEIAKAQEDGPQSAKIAALNAFTGKLAAAKK